MAAPLPGSLQVQGKFPIDNQYLIGNSQITTLDTGLIYQGLLRFSKSDDTLWIKLSTGWKNIPLSTSSNTLTIGTVTSGQTASASIIDNKLNLVLPKGDTASINLLLFNEYTVESLGRQEIPLPSGARGVINVLVLDTSGYTESIYHKDYSVSNEKLIIDKDSDGDDNRLVIGDRIIGYYYTSSTSGNSPSDNNYVVESPIS